jgi:hypothetical protein
MREALVLTKFLIFVNGLLFANLEAFSMLNRELFVLDMFRHYVVLESKVIMK